MKRLGKGPRSQAGKERGDVSKFASEFHVLMQLTALLSVGIVEPALNITAGAYNNNHSNNN